MSGSGSRNVLAVVVLALVVGCMGLAVLGVLALLDAVLFVGEVP